LVNRLPPADRDPTPVKAAEYVAELLKVPEISLHTFGATPRHFQRQPGGSKHPMLELIDSREDLRGLPVRRDDDALLDHRSARTLDVMSRQLRGSIGNVLTMKPVPPVKTATADRQTRSILTITGIGEVRPTLLVWVLQAEGEVMRRDMLDLIGHKPSAAAAEALAQRALFDPDPALRRKAVKLLQACPPDVFRAVLLAGLRYPWVTAADNAAAALIALNDRGAVPELVQLLDEPNPSGPVPGEDGTPTMHELMRVNHFHNCQLCHAPSWDRSDLVRGPVPSADRTLPSPYGGQNYYAGGTSSGYKSRSSSGGRSNGKSPGPPPSSTAEFVRADVSYLRPDFSMSLPVADPGPWPKMQRYDFFVRTRAAQPWELSTASASQSYPQRDAVLRVLRHLANHNFGDTSASWRAGLGLPTD
jgi:hypothetical protein